MVDARPRQGTPHLLAGLIASGLVAGVLLGAEVVAVHFERATVRASAPELFSLKNQGLAFQRVAARSPYVLPLYGSSELTAVLVPERAHIFFRTAPTGFQVSPVGAGGANSLIMLQKIAALGTDLRGKKVAISLSPGWFLKPGPGWLQGYKGNFSLMAASEMAFGTALDFELKRDIASRMLKFPGTLENSPLLEFALKRLASGRWLDRLIFCALWPIGKAHRRPYSSCKTILRRSITSDIRSSPQRRFIQEHPIGRSLSRAQTKVRSRIRTWLQTLRGRAETKLLTVVTTHFGTA